MKRSRLAVDTLYYVSDVNMYVLTPDRVGVYWYDTQAEAFDAHGEVTPISIGSLQD